jgi:hypothetical protein
MVDWTVQRLGLLMTGTLLALLLTPGIVLAGHHGQGIPDEVAIEVSFRNSTLAGAPGQLAANLRLDDGSPLVGVEVAFWREVDFLGARRVLLGRNTTGSDGTASVAVAPSEVPLRVVASFAGLEGYLAAEGVTEISAVIAGAPPDGESGNIDPPASLAVLAALMPPVLAFVALAVWLLLLGLTLVTVRAIRAGRPSAGAEKGRT